MADDEQVIRPSLEKVVDFYGDKVPAALDEGGKIYVPVRQLSDNLGTNFSGQRQRILRDPVMAAKVRQVEMQVADGRRLVLMCLPIEMIPGWLFGVTTGKMKPELHEKLNRYRADCFEVLWNAFKGDVLPASAQLTTLSPAEQILAQAEAIAAIARQQVELERQQRTMAEYTRGFIVDTRQRLSGHDAQLAIHDQNLSAHEQRLVSIELRLDPAANITDEQAAEIALAVKNVAYAIDGGSASYGKVYSEMYRRYRISSYKNLPQAKYDEVIQWLSRWYDDIAGQAGK